jgi:peptidyl-prolyl cis-trans isomerase SurA
MKPFFTLTRALVVSALCGGAYVLSAQTIKPAPAGGAAPGLSVRSLPQAIATPEVSRASDFIVAVVDNEPITNQDVNRLASMADPAAAQLGRNNLLIEALETLIDEAAQIGIAKQYGIQIGAEELAQAIERTAQRNQISITQMQQRLQEQNLSWEQYRAQVRRQMQLQKVREKEVNARIKIQDFEVDDFLQARNIASNPNADINIAHILFELPENPTGDQVARQLTKADEVMRKLKAGEDFSNAWGEKTRCASR